MNSNNKILDVSIHLMSVYAKVPVYSSEGAGGFDFFSIQDAEIYPGKPVIVSTGIRVEVPSEHVMLLFSRSGHGFKNDTRLANCVGVIDSDYRGEVKIKLTKDINEKEYSAKIPLLINRGDRIAQGIIVPYPRVNFNVVDDLSETERGHNGMGSTGR